MTNRDQYNRYQFPELISSSGDSKEGYGPRHMADTAGDQQMRKERTEAYNNGFSQGRDKAMAAEASKSKPMQNLLQQAHGSLLAHQRHIHSCSDKDMVHLAVMLARDIVQCEIRKRPELTTRIARKALQMVCGQENLKIKTHPADCETIRSIAQENDKNNDTSSRIEVASDQGIARGGCLIETDFGVIDGRIEQQLNAVSGALEVLVERQAAETRTVQDRKASFETMVRTVKSLSSIKAYGHVSKVVGLVVEANGPAVQIGSICDIYGSDREAPIPAEVLGFRDRTVLMMPLEEIRSIGPGNRVVARNEKASAAVGQRLLGRVIDGLGNPIDNGGPLGTETNYPIYARPINPLLRQRIRLPLDLGVRCINGLLTVGCGQRMGIFAGSGVGKSVLMGMIARKSRADVNVIALIGERGRELNEFIDKELGEEGLKKSVVVVATSDHLPLVRVRGAFVATAIAEYFRDQGMHVNLMMDSLTRFAMAQREIGLALGEPPTTKGYTPSVFTLMPKLLERAGTSDHAGTITGLYTVLVEGDDMNEPIADAARSILDGHIVLSRELADQNHYPAIDVLKSISRVMEDIASLQHKHHAGRLKELLATYRKAEDLINIGAYVAGSSSGIDRAIEKISQINAYLRQDINKAVDYETSLQQLGEIMHTG